ncbi:unnamed protein product [Linum trigynum]|uniref:Uncharacterized protein n=1 Tax=Linum trigynum TaxID=586398 RepID=A0AAV2G5Y3_9ROSI
MYKSHLGGAFCATSDWEPHLQGAVCVWWAAALETAGSYGDLAGRTHATSAIRVVDRRTQREGAVSAAWIAERIVKERSAPRDPETASEGSGFHFGKITRLPLEGAV